MTLGIGVMSFDRPHYLSFALEALQANDLGGCDVWLFQDGWQCHLTGKQMGSPGGVAECLELFRSAFPGGYVVEQERNIGIALNRLILLDTLAERYEAFLLIEDEVIVAPHYVAVIRKLLADFAAETDIGFLCSPVGPTDGQNPNALYRVASANCAIATRRAWFAPVRERYEEFVEVWRQYPYVPHMSYWQIMLDRYGDRMLCSSDVALSWCANEVGRYAWTLGAPRTRSIGVKGVHRTPEIFNQRRMGEVILREYEGELTELWAKVAP